jgi:hypothetical protein
MKHTWWVALLGCGALALGYLPSKSYVAADDKGEVVELDNLKSKAPAEWKKEEPAGKLRAYQFKLPKAKDDKADAELVIFYFGPGGGGSTDDNIARWKKQMTPPEGKKVDDVAKVEKGKVGDVPVTTFDMEGTYLFTVAPNDPNSKKEERPGYRFVGVVFESPKGPYFMRLVGPAKTVGEHKKAFDEWIKEFK